MGFVRGTCNEQLFAELELSAFLSSEQIGRQLIYDLSTHAALIPHPYHYANYPDRSLSFYVGGNYFFVNEIVQRNDGPDRIEIWFEDDADESTSSNICKLLGLAVAMLHEEAVCSMPIVARRKQSPKPRIPCSPNEIIPKLNKFCEDVVQFENLLPELKEMTIKLTISSVLLPQEIESLEKYLAEFGWNGLSPKAQDLIRIVFERTRK